MDTHEAAELVNALARALERNPDQFHYHVTLIAAESSAPAPGGTGASITAVGGAPSSSGIGVSIGTGDATASITPQQADAAMQEYVRSIARDVRKVGRELRKTEPDRERLSATVEALATNGAAPVLVSVITFAIEHAIGKFLSGSAASRIATRWRTGS